MKIMLKLFSILFIVLTQFIFTENVQANESIYERVMRTGKLRAGYATYSPILLMDRKTKQFSGIGYDILDLACKKLGVKLELTEEITWGTMIEGLRTNRYDIIACPVWANATRAKVVDFSRPLFYSSIHAYVKSGDKRFDSSLKNLNNAKYKVATMDGEMAELITKVDFPNTKRYSIPQMADVSELLLSVSSGKADITFAEPILVFNFSKHNPKKVELVTINKPVRIFPNTYMFNNGEERFKNMLNTTIDEIENSGELEKIILKYEPFPKAYLRVRKAYQD